MKFFLNKKYNTLTDLVKACQRLDPRAQTVFYERYKSELIGICLRYAKTKAEAEDIYQESFIKVFKHIDEVINPETIDSWIKSVVIRTAINYYHRTTKLETRHVSADAYAIDVEAERHDLIIERISVNELREIIGQLPDGYRIIINLHLIDGYSHVEIAKMLSISDSTSRSQFLRGRNLLIKKLQQAGISRYETL
ncbi:RNA polymerase sigma-70 factor, ECF subfamily [Dyadobacter sp. SG02]|uniref:RNA polymerase sigma factor n=1 Tax=Dyadobacter sp. SG02 TaxID=1855291 RepID=UPI0008D0EB60|nr:sigma-70 family RNA polymerase sigma factor [Dyadobacter sp. SG02]SEI52689.1 RNA polymerase sigma-70 factor, ECF subfamily [Dyadobacter sp. SG02]